MRIPITPLRILFTELCLVSVSNGWFFPKWWSSCYESPPIGCFPTSYPYNNTAGIAPQDPETIGVEFHFLKPGLPTQFFNIDSADEVLPRTYNSSAKTVILVHGYFENGFSSWIRDLSRELLLKDAHMNILVVDWFGGSSNLIYFQSVANARVVAAITGLLLEKLVDFGGDKSSFHVIGFSLGAHLAGYVGKWLPGVGRVTGLDPARPGFDYAAPEARLHSTDAIVVDVIHTDTAPAEGIGIFEPMGTVDFYPNGGVNQPGCPVSVMDRVSAVVSSFDFTSDSVRFAVVCSHLRVTSLFIASVNSNCSFPTRRCSSVSELPTDACLPCDSRSCPAMGYNLVSADVQPAPGVYATVTSSTTPYC
ncbi:hypothetical protein BsWGS_19493 [Bradybaena similaris]